MVLTISLIQCWLRIFKLELSAWCAKCGRKFLYLDNLLRKCFIWNMWDTWPSQGWFRCIHWVLLAVKSKLAVSVAIKTCILEHLMRLFYACLWIIISWRHNTTSLASLVCSIQYGRLLMLWKVHVFLARVCWCRFGISRSGVQKLCCPATELSPLCDTVNCWFHVECFFCYACNALCCELHWKWWMADYPQMAGTYLYNVSFCNWLLALAVSCSFDVVL